MSQFKVWWNRNRDDFVRLFVLIIGCVAIAFWKYVLIALGVVFAGFVIWQIIDDLDKKPIQSGLALFGLWWLFGKDK